MKIQLKALAGTTVWFVGIVSTSAVHANEKCDPYEAANGRGNMTSGGHGGL